MNRQDTLSTFENHSLFPDEGAAVKWFEGVRWQNGRSCPHCGSTNTVEATKPQPYRCKDCRKHFSCKTGTLMHSSNLPVRKWLYAMYLMKVSKKGLSSIQLGRELGIAQEAAWRMGHKIRETWNQCALFPMTGEVEVDETHIGGKEKNKYAYKRLNAGRGPVGKTTVVGIRSRDGKVRVHPVENVDKPTLLGAIRANVALGSIVYTDDHRGYRGMREYRHETVAHSDGQYVDGQMESKISGRS